MVPLKILINHPSFIYQINRCFSISSILINKHSFTDSECDSVSKQKSWLPKTNEESFGTWRNLTKTTPAPLRSLKMKSDHDNTYEFIDYKSVRVKGGRGGDGMICFLQLWSNPQAGPSGGDGGNGGHVVFEACKDTKSLNKIKSSYTGLPGQNGMHKDMTGKNAEHTFIKVPIGTLVKNGHSGEVIADLYCDKMKFLAAKGGAGGKGNHYFLSNKNRHPRVAEVGANGQENFWVLEMKIIAHAGLVGFPNVGKSTLLRALSRAKPKVASYPFTTLKPSIGIVHYEDEEQLAIADLPGIVQGAHQNKGLGIAFLRHIERCICLFYVIDFSVSDPFEQLTILIEELTIYNKDFSTRPATVIVNKIDACEQLDEKLKRFNDKLCENNLQHLKVIAVSAKYGHNLTKLLVHFRQLYDLNHLCDNNDQDDVED